MRGLALSLSIAYTVAALLALAVFRQWFGRLAERETWAPLVRVVIASVPMGVVVLVVSNLSGSTSVAGLLARVVGAVGGRRPDLRRGGGLAGPAPRRAPAAAARRPPTGPAVGPLARPTQLAAGPLIRHRAC